MPMRSPVRTCARRPGASTGRSTGGKYRLDDRIPRPRYAVGLEGWGFAPVYLIRKRLRAVVQSVAIACWASRSCTWPEQIAVWSFDST